jgi:hypothetical protein
MAKPTVRISQQQPTDLVMLSFGWYGKYVMPVGAASQIVTLLMQSGAVKVESANVEGISWSFLHPVKMDFDLQPLSEPFMSDVPIDAEKRKGYLDYLKTKAALVGSGYCLESYAAYLEAKEE